VLEFEGWKACVEKNLDMGLGCGVILLLDPAESALARNLYNVYDYILYMIAT